MKRIALVALVLIALPAAAGFSLDVARGELESAKDKAVAFVNYEGPPSRLDSLAEIKGIGSALGREAASGRARAGDAARYAVVRVVDPSAKEGFDADIVVIGADAQVDHVRNLRWIIAGYLKEAWRYSEGDAYLVATFVTVYNAVYRGDMAYFGAKYKKAVLAELTPATAGLSTKYTEWPGRSRIVIPLSSGAAPGKLGAVDTGAVAGKAVTESLRQEPGKGIPERQAVTDLKEREAAQKQAEVESKKAEVAKQETAVAAEKARVAEDRAKLEADKAAAAKAPAAEGPAAARAGQAAPAAEKAPAEPKGEAQSAELAKREAEVAAEEKAVAAKEAEVAAKKEEIAKGEAEVAAKKEEAAQERAAVTQDQKAAIAAEVAAKGQPAKAGIFLFKIVEDSFHLAQIQYVEAEGGALVRASRLNSLHPRSILDLGDSFLAVAGREGAAGGVRIVKIDKESLGDLAAGTVDVFGDSPIWKIGERLYAVVRGEDGSFRIGLFGADLKESARSADAVNPYGWLSEGGGGVVAQTPAGGFVVLAADTLKRVRELKQ